MDNDVAKHIKLDTQWLWVQGFMDKDNHVDNHHRLVIDLKAKDIEFMCSVTNSLSNITFDFCAFHGHLHVPTYHMTNVSKIFFLQHDSFRNITIQWEKLGVLSYVNFMKSLLESLENVKELQEKGIITNYLANHDKVIRVLEELDTIGLTNVKTCMNSRKELKFIVKVREKHGSII